MKLATAEKPHKTRAQVLKDKVKIRLATNEAGPLIAEVLKANGIEIPGANWDSVFPHWLIATVDDEVIGCIQVMPAKPIGWLEFLYVKPSSSFKFRAIAIRKLLYQGLATIKMAGAQYAGCPVDSANVKFGDMLIKMNFVKAAEAHLLVKKLETQ